MKGEYGKMAIKRGKIKKAKNISEKQKGQEKTQVMPVLQKEMKQMVQGEEQLVMSNVADLCKSINTRMMWPK